MKNLVIVESASKSKTIGKYLGKNYQVLASYGHVRDLLSKQGAVAPEKDFHLVYQIVEKNSKHVAEILEAVRKSDAIFLATDPDREGEAIAYHIYALMEEAGLLKGKSIQRIVFHEITKTAILEALEHPRGLLQPLIDAQQARRALDHLVGFTLSPLLWKKIRSGLSAGRVQSPALRMIVQRQEEIEKFERKEYWTIEADVKKNSAEFMSKLTVYQGSKLEQFSFSNTDMAHAAVTKIQSAAGGQLIVRTIEEKQRKRHPSPPFMTSTLQQEAVRKLGFTAKNTMRVAQQLYEGVDLGEGAIGLITYMRTDSVHLADSAIAEIRAMIGSHYGAEEVPSAHRVYKTKTKNAQEAHEGIRPTDIRITPDQLKKLAKPELFKLYDLIWKRTIASQMESAIINTVAVDLSADTTDQYIFRATGSSIKSAGYLRAYEEGVDEIAGPEQKMLPVMKEGEKLPMPRLEAMQHFTEPPPAYSEATLIKVLEEHGIGRPSTYTSIIGTLQQREYVTLDKKRFCPTDVGRIVSTFLTNYFKQYVDYDFTAKLEDSLDAVSRGEVEWKPLLKDFWEPFKEQVASIESTVQRSDVTQEAMNEQCPDCQKPLSIRLGKRGRFVGCTGYPDCSYTRGLDGEPGIQARTVVEDRTCPLCTSALQIKQGRYGKFIGCSNYPTCKHLEPFEKPQETGVSCPECHQGNMVQRKSRYGKVFYSCHRYPDCKYALWYPPVNKPCAQCQWPLTMIKTTKRRGVEVVCPQKACNFAQPYNAEV